MKKNTTPLYKEGLKGLREQLKELLPENSLSTFDNDADLLTSKFTTVLQLKEGDKAPAFSLINALGKTIKLEDFLKKGKVVLVFYRGTWCPYCNLQLSQYQSILQEIKENGASLLAISPQNPDASLSLKEKNELQFEVLSDNGNIVSRKFTTIFKNGNAPIDAMANLGYDYDSFYSDDSRELPVPAVFIIDKDGTILFSKSEGGDYRNRVEPLEIIKILKTNNSSKKVY